MRLGDLDNLKNKFWHGDGLPNKDMYHISEINYIIDNAPTVEPDMAMLIAYAEGCEAGKAARRKVCDSCKIHERPTVEITEEQAIDKLHETGWLPRHDKEMTEQPTGEWIYLQENPGSIRSSHTFECSACTCAFAIDGYSQIINFRICPNCGAKMKGGEEDE